MGLAVSFFNSIFYLPARQTNNSPFLLIIIIHFILYLIFHLFIKKPAFRNSESRFLLQCFKNKNNAAPGISGSGILTDLNI